MAFATSSPSAISLSRPCVCYRSSVIEPLYSFKSLCRILTVQPTLRCLGKLSCTATLRNINVVESARKLFAISLLRRLHSVDPLEGNPGAQGGFDLCAVNSAIIQFLKMHTRQLGTLSVGLILGSAFYSDIAPPNAVDTLENIPQELKLSGEDKPRRIQKPKSKKAEICTQKCLGTCIRGGAGSPGEGPFNVRRPLVVFKEGFRSRQYCLIECSEICNLLGDGDYGP